MTPLSSMTGHGTGASALGAARLSVEARSVNHRYLDVRVRLPLELAEHSGYVEELVRKALGRGRVEVGVRLESDPPAASLDLGRARAAFADLVKLRDAIAPGEPLPLALLASVPDLFVSRAAYDAELAREALREAVESALDGVRAMREREGAALASDLLVRIARLVRHVDDVETRVPLTVELARARLRERIEKLLAGSHVKPDTARLEQEIVLAADRADVSEECTRLRSHSEQLTQLVRQGGGDALGRKLDFLLQEMSREANTIGSKSADAEIARLVVELKADIERMREQAANVL